MHRSNFDLKIENNFYMQIFQALLLLIMILFLFSNQFWFLVLTLFIMILSLFEKYKLKHMQQCFQIQYQHQNQHSYIGTVYPFQLTLLSKYKNLPMTCTIKIIGTHNTFLNGQQTIIIESNAQYTQSITLPIDIQHRGRMLIQIAQIQFKSPFRFYSFTYVPKSQSHPIYCAYQSLNNFNIRNENTIDGQCWLRNNGDEKYANLQYDYTQPWYLIDQNASLKAQKLLIKQNEMPVQKKCIVTVNVQNAQNNFSHTLEKDLKMAHKSINRLLDAQFQIYFNKNAMLKMDESLNPILLQLDQKSLIHEMISEINHENYIVHYHKIVEKMLQLRDVNVWLHFGYMHPNDQQVIIQSGFELHLKAGEEND